MWQRIAMATMSLMLLPAGAARSADEEPDDGPEASSPIQVASTPLYIGEILKVDGGKITVRRASERNTGGNEEDLEVGRYVAMVKIDQDNYDPNDMRLLQANVTNVTFGVATLRQSRATAGKLKRGYQLLFYAVRGADDEQLAAAPELTSLQVDESVATRLAGAAQRAAAANNVKRIILGVHAFHDSLKGMPPAVIYGPDGEPWHSWRILILPFMGDSEVYDQYKFDEPWNGPNNGKLLDKMPDVYRDPVHGDDEGHFTHFAAITGEGMAFTAEGTRFDGTDIRSAHRGGRRLVDFLNNDGTSMTLLIGPVSPACEIPWLKPEDVVVDEDFAGFDDEWGFAAPHAVGDERYGVFAFGDGDVVSLPSDLEIDVLRKALTFDAGEDCDREEFRALGSGDPPADELTIIEYAEQDGEPVAILRDVAAPDDEPNVGDLAATIQMNYRPLYRGQIFQVVDGRHITLFPAGDWVESKLKVGRYVAIVKESQDGNDPDEMRLLQANVVGYTQPLATLQQSPATIEQLKPGCEFTFFAVRGADDEQLAAAPELTPAQFDPSLVAPPTGAEGQRVAAAHNLEQIIEGLHGYHDQLRKFPTAAMYGPDGEAWHSWRVFILPFIGESGLYDRYKFDEPWNGPNNSQLLDEMPAVYRDPAYGDDEGHFTHFAAITGEDMAFTVEGSRFDGTDIRSRSNLGRHLGSFGSDDDCGTLIVGSVSPERKIPWLKPEDVVVDEEFPGFDEEVGFAAPHAVDDEQYGIFGFAYGDVVSIPRSLEFDVLRKALTLNADDDYDRNELRSLGSSRPRADEELIVEYLEQDGETVAVLRSGEE